MGKKKTTFDFEARIMDDCLDALRHTVSNHKPVPFFSIGLGTPPTLSVRKEGIHRIAETERNWKFVVANPGMINFVEIGKDISRENPLICIREKSGNVIHRHYLIHDSIIRKAEIIFGTDPKPFTPMRLSPNLYLVQHGCLSESTMIDWVKAIKNRAWKEHEKKASVTVGVPKI